MESNKPIEPDSEEKTGEDQAIKVKGRKLSKGNHILVLAFIVVVLWQVGVFDGIGDFIDRSSERRIEQNFNTVTPRGNTTLKAGSGELTAAFINSAADMVTVEEITVKNLDGGQCAIKNKIPFELASNEEFNIKASNCAKPNAKTGNQFKLEVMIIGLRITYTVTPEELSNAEIMIDEKGRYMIMYFSTGPLEGTYS